MAEDKQKEHPESAPGHPEKKAPPGLLRRSVFLEEERPEEKLLYGFKGGVIAFVDFDGRLYLTAGTRIKIELLETCGFQNRRPQIEVPYSDGSTKSKRWLRSKLPRQEILHSVEENRMPKLEGKVLAGILRANREGLSDLDAEFLGRCARAEETFHSPIGLAATFRGILSFTDWDMQTWVTPSSDRKLRVLEEHGYTWVESMIKVPHALDNPENRRWLATHIPLDEWDRTEHEVIETRASERMEKARRRIEELGLKELPAEFLAGCVAAGEADKSSTQLGLVGVHNGILAFTAPDGMTWVTPATTAKVEQLKSLGYQFMGSAIRVPHSLKSREDIDWLQANIPAGEWENARHANQAEQIQREAEMSEKRQRALKLENLPGELVDRSILTELKQPNSVGQFFVRNHVLAFVGPDTFVRITPEAGSKIKLLKAANYHQALTGFKVPHSDNTSADLKFIESHLSSQEIERSLEERREEKSQAEASQLKKVLDSLKLKPLPADFLERCIKVEPSEIELIGQFCSRGDVTAFIHTDSSIWITPFTPAKEKVLQSAGYVPPQNLIRVPYGSQTPKDIAWLEGNLPPGELERSRKELEETDSEKKQLELKAMLEKRKITAKLAPEIASRAVRSEVELTEAIGQYIVQGEWLGIVGPEGRIWITPHTEAKVERLKKENYKYASQRFNVPHSSNQNADREWRELHLPKGEIERTRLELAEAEESRLDHMALDLAKRRSLEALPEEFMTRALNAGKVNPQMVGRYLERNQFLYAITPDRCLHITPVTPGKQKILNKAGYHFPEKIEPLPYFSDDPDDLGWIENNLPPGELDKSEAERQAVATSEQDSKVRSNIAKFKLKPVPPNIEERAADSGQMDENNVGRLGLFRGVLAWVGPDERVFVTWYTPDKQELMEECGYKLEGRLPIRVPYALADKKQRRWLIENLPKADDEEQISVDENAENM